MGIKKKETVELDIIGLAFGGKGIAKPDGFPVFVDRALPGDRVLARVVRKKKSWAEARLVDIVEPSKERIEAPCQYAGHCGGCRWQSLPYERQLEYKSRHVSESLEHIGLIRNCRVLPAMASARTFGFRNKMEFSCVERRWLTPEELVDPNVAKDFGLGLHVPGTFDRVINIDACLIQPEPGNTILRDLRRMMIDSGLPAYGLRTHEGFWRFAVLRNSAATGDWMVNLVTSSENDDVLVPMARELMERHIEITSVVNNVTAKKAGIAIGDYERCLAGDPFIRENLGPFCFEISAGSFFQTNTLGAQTLYAKVAEYAKLTGTETVIDLYSGTGTIPIWLSPSAAEVVGIEIVESAVNDAFRNAHLNGIDNCRFLVGDIRDVLPTLAGSCDVMIIDPPRAGMHRDVVEQVVRKKPQRIVYVSCNPATLARDMALLKDHYTAVEVQPIDLFPHTFHIESVALLEPV